jgi:3-dehydroquinate synthase
MNKTLVCKLQSTSKSYLIEIGDGLSNTSMEYLKNIASKFAIITDDYVAPLYGEKLYQQLLNADLDVHLLTFPHGEIHKSRETKEQLENQLFEKSFGRDTCIIALGGGVVTDLAGYIAATYCRGVPLVMMPTSLLGMVDASIGGKTGVNVSYGKNLLGCIYQPEKVVIDLTMLKSLPKKEWTNGVVEMIKHGIIADKEYFFYLENHVDQLKKQHSEILGNAIWKSCYIKNSIVEQDEKEQGIRRLLNFGHTIGHVLETLTDYSLAHGEAVAIGMLVEGYLSLLLGFLPEKTLHTIKNVLAQYELPLRLQERIPMETIMNKMILDKKSLKGRPRFVVIKDIGVSQPYNQKYCTEVDESLLKTALKWMNDDLHSY